MAEQTDARTGISWGWVAGDSAWGADVNKNFEIIAYRGTHLSVKSITPRDTQPTNPNEGDCYIVGPSSSGDWQTFASNSLAVWGHSATGGALAWLNFVPNTGTVAYDEANSSLIGYNGTAWSTIGTRSGGSGGLTIAQIVTGLSQLTGANKLSYNVLKDLPDASEFLTSSQRDRIQNAITTLNHEDSLTGDPKSTTPGARFAVTNPLLIADRAKLDALPITGATIKGQLEGLSGTNRLSASAIKDLPQGGPSSDNGATIKGKLEGLAKGSRLRGTYLDDLPKADWNVTDTTSPSFIENKPTLPTVETGATIRDKLQGLSGANRLSANFIKDLPSGPGGSDTAAQIRDKLEQLTGGNRLPFSATTGVTTSEPVEGDGQASTPVTLSSETKSKLSKLDVTQPTFTPQNYQADFDESNENSYNYIRNKPPLGGSGTPTIRTDDTITGDNANTPLGVAVPYSTDEKNKLRDIESRATADQTPEEIRDDLQSLSGANRLNKDAIKDLREVPTGGTRGQIMEATGVSDGYQWADAGSAQGEQNVQSDWNETDTTDDSYIKNKPDVAALQTSVTANTTKLAGIENMATGDQSATEIRDKLQSLTDQARLSASAIRGLPAGSGGGVSKDTVIECISEQAGTRVDDLIEAVTNLSAIIGSVSGDTINFNDNDDIVKSVNNVDQFMAGMYSLLTISGGSPPITYDPIVLDNDFILAKPAVTPPIRLSNIATQFSDTVSQEFLLLRDGSPISVTGSDPKVYHTIRVGRSTNNSPLIAKITPTTALSLTIRVARLSSLSVEKLSDTDITSLNDNHILVRSGSFWMNTALSALGAQFKTALEALTGANRLSSSAIKDLLQVPSSGTTGFVLTKTDTGYAFQASTATANPLVHDSSLSGANTASNPTRVTYPLTSTSSAKLDALETDRQLPDPTTGSEGQVPKLQSNDTVSWEDVLSASDKAKIDETFDLVRQLDDVVTITPGNSVSPIAGEVGFANYRTGGVTVRFGVVRPSTPNPPTFVYNGVTYSLLTIRQTATGSNRRLTIQIGGATSSVTTVPDLPDFIEFKVGSQTLRGRDFHKENITGTAGSSGSPGYIQYLKEIGSETVLSLGSAVTFQFLLGTDNARLLPTGGDPGEYVRLDNDRQPEWASGPSNGGGTTTINVDDTLKKTGTNPVDLGIADSVMSKIDEAYDLVRLIDDEFTITPAVSGGNIGYVQGSYGSVDPVGNIQFTDGMNTWKITELRTGTTDRDLVIRIGGVPDVTADGAVVASLPTELDFKIGDKEFRGRTGEVESVDADPNSRPAEIAYLEFLFSNTDILFTAGTPVACQVLLKGTNVQRLLPPAMPSDVGKAPVVQSSGDYALQEVGLGEFALELLDAHRGLTIAQTDRPIIQPLSAFTQAYTLGANHHGVILVSIQATVASGSTSQLALGTTTTSTTQVFLGVLRDSSTYDGSPGNAGNGVEVAEFAVNNTSGTKQGDINCYIARNTSNQVGTYATYTASAGASNNLAGSIQMRWEVTLLRTEERAGSGGASVTDAHIAEVARDNVAAALQLGDNEATADIVFSHNDVANSISARIKTGAIIPADVKRDSTDNTKAATLSAWQTLFGITSGPVVPQPVSLPELFVTRLATDPADVLTIRDTRGYLNETHLVGTTFNLFKGGTAMSQTALTANPFTVKARLTGGVRQTTQRIQIDKNVTFTSSAAPVSTSMFNADVYYMVIGVRATSEADNFHLYDDAESFITAGNTNVRGVAYNPVRSFISTIDGGSTKRHLAYSPTGGGAALSVYTQNLVGDPQFLSWDPDGRHLYVAENTAFKVYDFGANTSPTTLTISRVTSKEFAVTTWFAEIKGIKVTASQVLILGKRTGVSTVWAVDRFNKSDGTRVANDSDIYLQKYGGVGLEANTSLSRLQSIDSDGDHVANLSVNRSTPAVNYATSFRMTFPSQDSSNPGMYAYISGRVYRTSNATPFVEQISYKTGSVLTRSSGTILPSGQRPRAMTSAGNYLYVQNGSYDGQLSTYPIYVSDQSQPTPTHQLLGGITPSRSYETFCIHDNKIFHVYSGDNTRLFLDSYPLTGSVAAGYTAIGNTATRISSDLIGERSSSTMDIVSDGTNLWFYAYGYTSSIHRLYKIDPSTGASSVVISNTGLQISLWYDTDRQILHYKNYSLTTSVVINPKLTNQNSVSRLSTTSFPLGSRQGNVTGLGQNETADKFYVANGNRVNVYDKRVTGATKSWLHDSIYDILILGTTGNAYADSIAFSGSRMYVFGNRYVTILEYPTLVLVNQFQRSSDGSPRNHVFEWNGSFYDFTGDNTIREFSIANGEWLGSNITLTSAYWFQGISVDRTNNYLYVSDSTAFIMHAYSLPATGKITASTIAPTASRQITLASNTTAGTFIRNGFMYHLYSFTSTRWSFHGYTLTSFTRASDQDFQITVSSVGSRPRHLIAHGDKLYAPRGSNAPRVRGFVRAV